jgi:hypothetical protein
MFKQKKQHQNTSLREEILFPEKSGLSGKNKPLVLIVNSVFDKKDSSTKYQSTKKLAEERGYTVINKQELIYDPYAHENTDAQRDIKPGFSKKSLTLWFEAHGAPGWLFGPGDPHDNDPANHPNHKSEKEAANFFCAYLSDIEKKTELRINHIILNTCFSATELVNDFENQYLNSSARLLSILIPNKLVLGFIGHNASAKISHVWEFAHPSDMELPLVVTDKQLLKEGVISLLDASILFKDGSAIEFNHRDLYCSHINMQPFILNSCKILPDLGYFYKLNTAKETVETLRKTGFFGKDSCFADRQINNFKKIVTPEQPEREHRP